MSINLSPESKKSWKILFFRFLRLTLVMLLIPPVFVGGFFVYDAISRPIIYNNSKRDFEKLDATMKSLYKDIQTIADGEEKWEYSASCNKILSGIWGMDEYNCEIIMSQDKNINSLETLNKSFNTYLESIKQSSTTNKVLSTNDEIHKTPSFGKNFSVSTGYVEFKYMNDISCTYTAHLTQTKEHIEAIKHNPEYGNEIIDTGRLMTVFSCRDSTIGDWF